MKRLSERQRQWQIRICRRRTVRRWARRKKSLVTAQQAVTGEIWSNGRKDEVILFAPEMFDLEEKDTRRAVLRFLSRLRTLVVLEKKNVRISFAKTKRMIAPGTLLLTAELHRLCRYVNGTTKISCSYPANNKVEQVLQQIGIFKLLKKHERLVPSADDVIYWRFIDGQLAEGEKANALIAAFAEELGEAVAKTIYNGLVEAMTNCVHHAYEQPRDDELKIDREKGWWMFAQQREETLSIVICDLGIGIPNSLPKTHDPNILKQALESLGRAVKAKGHRDVDYIRAALAIGKSRTHLPGRGYGLSQFKEVVEKLPDARLRIYSNQGCYTFFRQNGETIERRDEYRDSILGTLVQWNVPLANFA